MRAQKARARLTADPQGVLQSGSHCAADGLRATHLVSQRSHESKPRSNDYATTTAVRNQVSQPEGLTI